MSFISSVIALMVSQKHSGRLARSSWHDAEHIIAVNITKRRWLQVYVHVSLLTTVAQHACDLHASTCCGYESCLPKLVVILLRHATLRSTCAYVVRVVWSGVWSGACRASGTSAPAGLYAQAAFVMARRVNSAHLNASVTVVTARSSQRLT